MAPRKTATKRSDVEFTEEWSWETIDDFTHGIISKGAPTGGPTIAPLGSAQLNGTYACRGIKNGGLIPLPKMTATFNLPTPDIQGNLQVGYFNLSGFFAFGPVGPPAAGASGIPDDLFVGVEWLKSDGTRRLNYDRMCLDLNSIPVEVLATVNSAVAPTTEQYRGMCFVVSRINPNTPYITPGNPVVIADWSPPGFGSDKHIWVFPDPANPTTSTVVELYTASGLGAIVGDLIAHQNRIIILEDVTYPFGAQSGDRIPTNEQISFTDPPNSNTFDTNGTLAYQREVFVQEYPNGYGAWGSISAGELFLIKSQGGGVIISGSIDTPTVTRLPGVVSTNGIGNRAASMPNGLIYYSRFDGAYIWRGADTATKISEQLDDLFPFYANGPGTLLNQQICWQEWGDWVLGTNGYLYDTNTSSWWQLDNPATYTPQWYSRSFFGEDMYAAPLRYTVAGATGAIRKYHRTTLASLFSWQSHPIPVSVDRVIDIRELVLLVQGQGTVVVTMSALDGTTVSETFTINDVNQPHRLRLRTECRGYNIVVKMVSQATATGAAPTIYSLSLGYRDQVFATNV